MEKLKRQKSRQIEWGQFLVSRIFSIECDFLLVFHDFRFGQSIVCMPLLLPIKKVREINLCQKYNLLNFE